MLLAMMCDVNTVESFCLNIDFSVVSKYNLQSFKEYPEVHQPSLLMPASLFSSFSSGLRCLFLSRDEARPQCVIMVAYN